MSTLLNRALIGTALLMIALPTQAAMWKLDQTMSTVVFKYNYGSDPYEGTFSNVEANFDIDPMRPGNCKFDVTINIEDIDVDSPEVLDYLLDYELFDVDTWPTAKFQAESCRLTGVTSFESDGTLTIRDQTHPITFPFDLTSEVEILRLQFGVGQGYWANTAEVPNEVQVVVDVYATMQ